MFPLIILIAIFITVLVYLISSKYSQSYKTDLLKKAVPILIGVAIGARLLSALSLLSLTENSFWYNLRFGGSVFYGGIIGGGLSLLILCKLNKQSFFDYSDVLVSLFPLGHAIGRIGCYLNGCCYGLKHSGFLSVPYVINGENTRVIPTWFIESFFCLLLFIYLHICCSTVIRGIRTSIYFIFYSIFRFFIEFLRGDSIRGNWGVLSTSQIISIFALFFGLIALIISLRNKNRNFLIAKET